MITYYRVLKVKQCIGVNGVIINKPKPITLSVMNAIVSEQIENATSYSIYYPNTNVDDIWLSKGTDIASPLWAYEGNSTNPPTYTYILQNGSKIKVQRFWGKSGTREGMVTAKLYDSNDRPIDNVAFHNLPTKYLLFSVFVVNDKWGCGISGNNDNKINGFRNSVQFDGRIDYYPYQKEMYNFFNGQVDDSYNPYEGGGDSEPEGGDGDFDNSSDEINIPDLPPSSAIYSGFVNLFTPTLSQLQELASYMWSTDFFDNIIKLWANPMDVILGLSIVPVEIPSDGTREVKCGNVSTGVSMSHASTQYVVVDCGSINVNEYWGAYLDYSPYTKIQIYLPYCGTHSLDVDDVMGRNVHVIYHVDILSGSCVAYIKCTGKNLSSVLYEFTGNVSSQLPVTGENFTRLIQTAISSVSALASTVATGGLSAPMAISSLSSLASNVGNSKPEIERSGSVSGSVGLMGIQKPYLILTRPRQCIPSNYQKYSGFPSMMTRELSKVTGFTIIDKIFLKNISASESEIDEIKNILKEGIIL